MDIFSTPALLIYSMVLFTSWFSGITGMGGGIILLALMSLCVPPQVLVPLHAMLILGTTLSRTYLMRAHILWRMVLMASGGVLVGVWLGASIQVSLPPTLFSFLLGLALLVIVWLPKGRGNFNLPLPVAGLLHGGIATIFGSGGVLQAVFSRLNLGRHERVATFTTIMLWLNLNKIGAFTAANFDVMAYLPMAVIAGVLAFAGSYGGKLCLDRLSDTRFDLIFKTVVTLLALRLVAANVAPLWSAYVAPLF